MTQYFSQSNAGERYATYRPKVHAIILEWLEYAIPGRRFEHAVDVACGTGDSMSPLFKISENVLGIDSSDDMLDFARRQGFNVAKADYSALAQYGRFDLISTCMAFHWFDSEKAIASYKAASNHSAIWLIYNFGFGGHSTSDGFNQWFHQSYLKNYPSPSRGKTSNVRPESDPEIELLAKSNGWIPVDYTKETLIGYLSTQSNIEEQFRQGKSIEEIKKAILSQLTNIDISGHFKYVFTYEILEYKNSQQPHAADAGDPRR